MYYLKDLAYGYEISDDPDFPEISIYILLTTGQSGHCSLVVSVMACDGGVMGLPNVITNIPYGACHWRNIPEKITESLVKVGNSISFLNNQDIPKIVNYICEDLT